MRLLLQCKYTVAQLPTGVSLNHRLPPFLLHNIIDSLPTALESTSKDLDHTLANGPAEKSQESLDSVERATALTAEFEKTGNIENSDEAILILESLLKRTPENHPDRHYILFNGAITLCRRVEIQVSRQSTETLLDLHRALGRCVFLLRQAVNVSPSAFDVKVQYLGQLGHTAALWSTILSSRWPAHDVLALLAQLQAERDAPDASTKDKITGFVSAVIMASTFSTAFGVTQDPTYRSEGREIYRRLLK